jgi:transposase
MLGISVRTLQRWEREPDKEDQRAGPKSEPENSLSEAEEKLVVAVANSPCYRELSPSQIVPILADSGVYIASEATFYRILRKETLKYRPEYPSVPFQSLQESRSWMVEFERWYNHEHRHSGIKFVSPASRHFGDDEAILLRRKKAYEEARRKNPRRWSRGIRNWDRITEVRLNPSKRAKEDEDDLQKSA